MERADSSSKFPLGSKLPEFKLPNVDGRQLGSDYLAGAKASLVVFSCNHCPYVKGSEALLIDVVRQYAEQGLKTVAISSNDAVQYPEDGFEKMKEKAREMNLPYPYLYDESQQTAKLFDAACTPECYLFDSNQALVFHGTINDSPRDPNKVTNGYLAKAIQQVLEDRQPDPSFVHPIGCSIKWR